MSPSSEASVKSSDFKEMKKVYLQTKLILSQQLTDERDKQTILLNEVAREKSLTFQLNEDLEVAMKQEKGNNERKIFFLSNSKRLISIFVFW